MIHKGKMRQVEKNTASVHNSDIVSYGQTWLINKMAKLAENHPDLKCGWLRYEVNTIVMTANSALIPILQSYFQDFPKSSGHRILNH